MKIDIPVNIGDDIYFIPSKANIDLCVLRKDLRPIRVCHQKIAYIAFINSEITSSQGWRWYIQCDYDLEYGVKRTFADIELGEIWFLSENEAQAALERLEKECGLL